MVSNVDAVRVYDGETSEFLYLLEGVESYANRFVLSLSLSLSLSRSS